MSINEIRSLIQSGDFVSASKLLDESDSDSYSTYLLRAEIYEYQGRLEYAIIQAQKAFDLVKKEKDEIAKIWSLNSLSYYFFKQGKTQEALDFNNSALSKINDISNLEIKEHKDIIARSYHLRGLINRSLGNYEITISAYHNSLNFVKDTQFSFDSGKTYNNLGVTYRNLGEFEIASQNLEKAFTIFTKFEAEYLQAVVLMNIAIVQERIGNLEPAERFYLESITLHEKFENENEYSDALYYFINFLLRYRDLEETEPWMTQLMSIDSKTSSLIHLRQIVIDALYNRKLKRIKNSAKAITLLEEVIFEPLIDIEISIFAILNYCEMLIMEFEYYKNKQILNDLKRLIYRLDELSKSQGSAYSIAKIFYLKAQLFLLLGDINKARSVLEQSELMAQEKSYYQLLTKISNEKLYEKIDIIEEKFDEPDIHDIIEVSEIQSSIRSMIRKDVFSNESILLREIPVYFLIYNTNGSAKVSVNFNDSIKVNEFLVGPFLSAINEFLKTTFATDGHIQKLSHDAFNIIFIKEGELIFCYIYQNNAIDIINKVESFLNAIRKRENLWYELNHSQTLQNSQITEIKELIFKHIA